MHFVTQNAYEVWIYFRVIITEIVIVVCLLPTMLFEQTHKNLKFNLHINKQDKLPAADSTIKLKNNIKQLFTVVVNDFETA